MNKTVTINISGIIFHIEEDAFEKLSKYLNTIKGYFSNTDGGNEIMGDIESRIAEMLQTKTSNIKQVVLMADVDFVIQTMGKPEEFAGDNEQHTSQQNSETENAFNSNAEPVKKRMFRDPDNKSIGGVCSGIAAYFDVDIVWIRLAMFLLIFFGGVSLWVYIVLWIVIPEAKTTADKLAMRGEKIDINNISKTVKEEAEQLKKRMEKYGNDIKNSQFNQPRNFFDKFADFLKEFIILFTKFFARLIGLILLFFGIFFMFGLLSTIFGFSIIGSNVDFNEWVNLLFLERSHYTLGLIGILLFFGIPILMMIYGGIKLLFRIRYSNRWLNISAGLIWLIGFSIALYVGMTTGKDFADSGKIKQPVNLQQHDTIYLTLNNTKNMIEQLNLNEVDFDDEETEEHQFKFRKHKSNYVIANRNNNKIIVGYATLNIVPSLTENFELYIVKQARGEDRRSATERAKAIEYNVIQKDSVLSLDELFTVATSEKFRIQELKVILKVPRGKVVHLDKSLEHFIWDVENVTNTYDGDMVGRRWIMSKDGLECIDCEGLEVNEEKHSTSDPINPPPPPPSNLHVNAKDANVKIDKEGNIKVKSKDTEVNIGKDGQINVNTNEKK